MPARGIVDVVLESACYAERQLFDGVIETRKLISRGFQFDIGA